MRPLAPHTLQEELKLDVATLRSSPVRGRRGHRRQPAIKSRMLGTPPNCAPGGRQLPAWVVAAVWSTPVTQHADPTPHRLPFHLPSTTLPQMALMQAVLDHHHSSYSTELRAAAVALARREEGTAAASAMAAVANSSAASSPAAAELPGSTTS